MDLIKLRTFVFVAEMESISKAASALFRTQPAISVQIKELENETGLLLFYRKKSRVFLTREGRKLYEFSKPRIQELDNHIVHIRSDSVELEGSLKFGVQWELCTYLVPDIVRLFREKFPLVRFEIIQADHFELEKGLTSGKIDIALTILYQNKDLLDITEFITFERNVVASTDYLDKVPKINNFQDLLKLDFIGFDLRLDDYRFWFKKNGHPHLTGAIEHVSKPVIVKELHTAQQLIRKGLGIGFGDSFMLSNELSSGKIKCVLADAEPIYVSVDISLPKIRSRNNLTEEFYRFLKQYRDTLESTHSGFYYPRR